MALPKNPSGEELPFPFNLLAHLLGTDKIIFPEGSKIIHFGPFKMSADDLQAGGLILPEHAQKEKERQKKKEEFCKSYDFFNMGSFKPLIIPFEGTHTKIVAWDKTKEYEGSFKTPNDDELRALCFKGFRSPWDFAPLYASAIAAWRHGAPYIDTDGKGKHFAPRGDIKRTKRRRP